MENLVLSESATFASPDAAVQEKGIWRSRLIEADVQGSSGFYPAEVLRRDGAAAFPAGTHVYIDHPTETEERELPERSVFRLAGVLLDPATFEESTDGRGLFARIQFFEDVRDRIKSRWEHIGLSIRAAGEVEETATGRIVRSIREGLSVDVVTRAGAGGRLVTMTEAATQGESPVQNKLEEAIPASTGTGTLLNEVASMKAAFAEQLEQVNLQVTALTNTVKELQRSSIEHSQEYGEVKEAITFLKDRQKANDRAISEAKTLDETMIEILKSNLPLPSQLRVAKGFRPGDDLHESIQMERDYVKKLRLESERGELGSRMETSGLGLTESASTSGAESYLNSGSEDIAEFHSILNGKMF